MRRLSVHLSFYQMAMALGECPLQSISKGVVSCVSRSSAPATDGQRHGAVVRHGDGPGLRPRHDSFPVMAIATA